MRPRLRGAMPALAGEGADAARLAVLARRLRSADAAIELAVDVAAARADGGGLVAAGPVHFGAEKFIRLPAEVALRLLGRAIAHTGDEGPVELGKLETLFEEFRSALRRPKPAGLRRTLAGRDGDLRRRADQGRTRAPAQTPTTARHLGRGPSKRR